MRTPSEFLQFESGSTELRRLLRQEELILAVTEEFCRVMEKDEISRSDLAVRLDKSRAFVSQILDGGRNLTLRTIADVSDALQLRACFALRPAAPEQHSEVQFRVFSANSWSRRGGPDDICGALLEPRHEVTLEESLGECELSA